MFRQINKTNPRHIDIVVPIMVTPPVCKVIYWHKAYLSSWVINHSRTVTMQQWNRYSHDHITRPSQSNLLRDMVRWSALSCFLLTGTTWWVFCSHIIQKLTNTDVRCMWHLMNWNNDVFLSSIACLIPVDNKFTCRLRDVKCPHSLRNVKCLALTIMSSLNWRNSCRLHMSSLSCGRIH